MSLFKDYILYERIIFYSAWEKTREFSRKHFFIAIFVSLFSAIAVFLMNPLDQFGQLLSSLLALVTAFFLMFILVLFWYLFIAPLRLWKKQTLDIIDLQFKIQNNQDKQRVLSAFHAIADNGNALWVKRISEDEFEIWKQEVQDFRLLAIRLIGGAVSRTAAIGFNVTQTDINRDYVYKVNEEHNRQLIILGVQMDKLLRIIETSMRPELNAF